MSAKRDSPPGRTRRALEHRRASSEARSTTTTWRRSRSRSRNWTHLQLRRAVDQHGALHPDLHAGVGPDGRRHELVAGARSRSCSATRSCWCRSCSTRTRARSTASRSRSSRAPPTARSARTCRPLMRALVACGWFGIQAWIGGEALHTFFTSAACRAWPDAPRSRASRGHTTTEWLSFLLFWGAQHLHHLSRHGPAAARRELGGAVRAGDDRGAAVRGRCDEAHGLGAAAARSRASFHTLGRVPAGLRAVADRDDRLLGDAVAQHARLHALRRAASASRCSARWWRCRPR